MNRLVYAIPLLGLTGCPQMATPPSCYPISVCVNQIITEATSLHQLEMALGAAQQAPVVVMQPTPVVVTPNPVGTPPVAVTPVTPTTPVSPGGPIVTPNTRNRHARHKDADSPDSSAAALNAAQLTLIAAQ